MFREGLVLCLLLAGWAVASPASPPDEDLRASIVFNQLALAELLEAVKTITQDDAATETQLQQMSQTQKALLEKLSSDFSRVTSSVDSLSESLSSHLMQEDIISRELQMCTSITDALRRRVSLQEEELEEQRNAIAKLEEKRRQEEEKLGQGKRRKQQQQQQLFDLQTELLQRKNEEVQVKTEILEAKSRVQRAEGERRRLENELKVLKQQVELASERTQHENALLSSLKTNIVDLTEGNTALRQKKDSKAEEKETESRILVEVQEAIRKLTAEKTLLEQEVGDTSAGSEGLTTTKTQLEQRLKELNTEKSNRRDSLAATKRLITQTISEIDATKHTIEEIKVVLRNLEIELEIPLKYRRFGA